MTRAASYVGLIVALACTAGTDAAAADRFPLNEDLRHIRALSDPRLSPDGQHVLFQMTESTADGAFSHLWLTDIEHGVARQLTHTPAGASTGEHDGRWVPDGGSIVFLANRSGRTQLYRLAMNTGEVRTYDSDLLDIDSYAIAPDGKIISIIARDPDTAEERAQQQSRADAVRVDHDPHGRHLYFLEPQSGKVTAVSVSPDVTSMSWSRQGGRLVVTTDGVNNAADLGPAKRAWTVNADDPARAAPMAALPPTVAGGTWSEDGREFLFLAQSEADAPPGYSDLYALDTASGAVRNLTGGLTVSVGTELPVASTAGVLQLMQQGVRGTYMLFSRGKWQIIDFETPVVSQLSSNERHTGWVWLGSAAAQPDALYYGTRVGGQARHLNTPDVLPAGIRFPSSQLVRWKSDGLDIEGLLYLPPVESGRKVPLIVDVHEGPTNAWMDSFSSMNGLLVAQGWAVLRPNPRGSTGYGAVFAAANRNDLGGGDYRDIMAGVDAVIANYPIAADQLALIGYSYGGEMAGFMEGKTNRFKALVSGAPVIDQMSEYGTEDVSWYDRWFFGKPWERLADAWRQSPLAGVTRATTPMLLLQGLEDKIDPPGQSREMYRALRQANVEVELVEYPREDHYPLYHGIYGLPNPEPWHGFDARDRMVAFIRAAFDRASRAERSVK